MNTIYQKTIVFLALCSFSFYIVWYWKAKPSHKKYITIPFHQKYVNTEGCSIPYYDPFDKSVMPFYTKPLHLLCTNQTPLTYQDSLLLKLDSPSVSYCTSQTVIRDNNDDTVSFSDVVKFTESFKVSSEFVRVMCYNQSGSHVYSNVHAFILRNTTRDNMLKKALAKHKREHKPKEILNVMMIGVDSISRLNHIRLMPKTRDYLMHDLAAVDYQGYTKVADNTYVNVVPMLTGNFVEDENVKRGVGYAGPYDKYQLIWKNFSSNGYTTMMDEDAPAMCEFNYHKLGFVNPPAHHYIRPYALALEKENGVFFGGYHSCVWNRSETQVHLDYTYDFMKTYRDVPYFGWTFITRLTHGTVQSASFADDFYFQFLKRVKEEGLLDNTILFFFSDHGMRYGRILRKEMGKIELRMPLMNVVLPVRFRRKYPEMYKNAVRNANKLTSPFDIHATLKDILYFTGKPRKFGRTNEAGISLFDPIPGSRTCDQASISPHWCVCELEEIQFDDEELRKQCLVFILRQVNYAIRSYPLCAKRTLKSVQYMKRYRHLGARNSTISLIKTGFRLAPEGAAFEATVQHNSASSRFRLGGVINRINLYGNTADCMKRANLKKFCYCSKNSNSTTSQLKSSRLANQTSPKAHYVSSKSKHTSKHN